MYWRNLLKLPGASPWLVLSILFLSPVQSHAVEISSSHKLEQTHLWISMKWPEPVKFMASVGSQKLNPITYEGEETPEPRLSKDNTAPPGRKLIFRFDRGIEAKGISNLPQNIPDWIEDTFVGFDSIAIKTPHPSSFKIFKGKNRVFIKVSAVSPPKDKHANEELGHLKSALFAKQPKFIAHQKLSQFSKENPGDPQILADMAEVEEGLGRWREAMDLYAQSLELRPGNRDLYLSRSYLHEEHGPQVRADQYYQDTEDEEIQWVTRVLARQTFFKHYMVGVKFENRVIDDNEIRNDLDGNPRVFDGNRNRWEAYAERSHGFAHTRLSILGQEDEPGAALQHRRELAMGRLLLRGSYNEPYWEILEGIIDQGTVSQLQAVYSYEQPQPMIMNDKEYGYFSGLLGMSLKRFGVEDRNNVADSVEFLGEVRYHPSQLLSGLSFGYSLDLEYVDITDTRIDVNGDNFDPLPIEDIRNHAFDVSLARSYNRHWRYDLSAGYNFDSRTNDGGPFVLVNVLRDTLSNLQVGLNFEINQQLNRGENNSFTKIGAFLLWKL